MNRQQRGRPARRQQHTARYPSRGNTTGMEDLARNPLWPEPPEEEEEEAPPPATAPSKRKAATRRESTTAANRAQSGSRRQPSKATLRENARQQPRDHAGKFAEKGGGWVKGAWDGLFDPTPRAPTRLKPRPPRREARTWQHIPIASSPRRRGRRRRKKPFLQRSLLGKIGGVLSGDYSTWKQKQNQKNARLALLARGYDPPASRPRRRRRRRPAAPPPRRRFLGLF